MTIEKTVYDWAREFLGLGIAVFPVQYRNKTPALKWERYRSVLPTQAELKKWFLGGSLHNYGVVAGWQELLILDFDELEKYYDWQLWALSQEKDSPADVAASLAFRVRTARGVHIYLQIPGTLQNGHLPGLDIKRNGYVLGPGSTHPSGALYTSHSPGLIIPRVDSLESVLPAEWLSGLQHPPEPELSPGYRKTQAPGDPFEMASNPLDSGRDLIRQIRERHKLQDYLNNVRKTGENWYMACCPFHDDQSPSFWIDDLRQIGNCQRCHFPKPLDVINLYARLHRIPETRAIAALAHQ